MNRVILKLIFSIVIIFSVVSDGIAQSSNSSRGKKIEAYYIDPTWNDVSYRTMLIRVNGDKIIAYEDPFTKKFNECDVVFHRMSPQEKNQMKLSDSQGRSYDFYYGNCEYTAMIGKLRIYFSGDKYNLDDNSVYQENQVDEVPLIVKNLTSSNTINLKQFLNTNVRIPKDCDTGAWEVEVSFIVRADGLASDFTVLKSNHASLEKEVLRTIKSIKKWIPAKKDGKYVDCRISIPFSLKIVN